MSGFDWFSFVRVDNTRHTKRASSADPTGGNTDRIFISHGETRTLLDVKGAGCITHLWFTGASVEDIRELLESEPYARESAEIQIAGTDQVSIRTTALTDLSAGERTQLFDALAEQAGIPADEQLCSVFVRREDGERAAQLDAQLLRSQIPDMPEDFVISSGEDDQCPACGEPADLAAPECGSCGLAFRDAESQHARYFDASAWEEAHIKELLSTEW